MVCKGEIENWKHDIIEKGGSTLHPEVRRAEIKLNDGVGPYTEEQCVTKEFPKEKDEYKWHVLLPEALKRMTKNILQISEDQADFIMKNSLLVRDEVQNEFNNKLAKRARKHKAPSRPAKGIVPERMK